MNRGAARLSAVLTLAVLLTDPGTAAEPFDHSATSAKRSVAITFDDLPAARNSFHDDLLGRIIKASTEQVVVAMKALGKKQGISTAAVEINRLENEADRAHAIALRRLFEEEKDAIQIIKWKEILDFLEAATDRCEDVANVLEGVVVKHA